MPDKRIADIVRHHFGHQLTAADLEAVKRYSGEVAGLRLGNASP